MDIVRDWPLIRNHFSASFASSLHVAIASQDAENRPTNTPIGSLFLNKKSPTGFYFEKFPSQLPAAAQSHKNVCVLAVQSNKWFWIKSLFKSRFNSYPAVKLYGRLGSLREATMPELRALKRRMRFVQPLRGHRYLWGDMKYVRDISFYEVDKVNLGEMTAHL